MTRVLIVDDHPIMIEGCHRVLRDAGVCEIMEAATFLSAFLPYSTVAYELPSVRGWGETIIAFLVFKMLRPMQQTVDSGFVQGTTLATTPMGLANVRSPFSLSSSTSP